MIRSKTVSPDLTLFRRGSLIEPLSANPKGAIPARNLGMASDSV
jgi:hypothetical protein